MGVIRDYKSLKLKKKYKKYKNIFFLQRDNYYYKPLIYYSFRIIKKLN